LSYAPSSGWQGLLAGVVEFLFPVDRSETPDHQQEIYVASKHSY